VVLVIFCVGCAPASKWKIHGGPSECEQMCANWGLEFTAMVGVGSQEKTGQGATACVCQPKREQRHTSLEGAASSSTSLAAPITAAEQAAAAAQANSSAAAYAAHVSHMRQLQQYQYQR